MAKLSVGVLVLMVVLGMTGLSISITPTSAPVPAPSTQDGMCWSKINSCIMDHVSHLVEPRFNPASPSFNITELICCPLMVQTALTDRECFCMIDTVVHQDPSLASNVTTYLSLCGIVDSIASLDNFCLDVSPASAPSPAVLPPMMMPPLGL